jgi:dTDP-4-dehydrorhamnose 3,5-epimerase
MPTQHSNDLLVTSLALPEVKTVQPKYYEDYRGFFAESYSARKLKEYGIAPVFVQDDHCFDISKATFRGIHFQNKPHAQGKLIRCTRGTIMDFAVDLRGDSPTFRQWVYVVLSAENRKQIWIPRGFGHAYLTLADSSELQCKCDDFYFAELHRSIRYDDPEINLKLIHRDAIISDIDRAAPYLRDSDVHFSMEDNAL